MAYAFTIVMDVSYVVCFDNQLIKWEFDCITHIWVLHCILYMEFQCCEVNCGIANEVALNHAMNASTVHVHPNAHATSITPVFITLSQLLWWMKENSINFSTMYRWVPGYISSRLLVVAMTVCPALWWLTEVTSIVISHLVFSLWYLSPLALEQTKKLINYTRCIL